MIFETNNIVLLVLLQKHICLMQAHIIPTASQIDMKSELTTNDIQT